MATPVYLDYNASAPLKSRVRDAMLAAMKLTGNASSVHRFGRAARREIEAAREKVARLVNARAEQIVFTSGGTEANNLAVAGSRCARVILSAIEHDSVCNAAPAPEMIPVRPDGVVDLDALAVLLRQTSAPTLVSIMLANNETGVLQPVAEAAALAHAAGAFIHCDAVQVAGRRPLDFPALQVDFLSLSAHKLGGPQGIGALVVGEAGLAPLLRGGGQERNRRAGTENMPAIVGFGLAADLAREDLSAAATIESLRDAMEARIRTILPDVRIFGAEAPRLPNTSCIAAAGLASEVQVMALDLAGIAISAGAACSSGKVRPSRVVTAMGATPAEAASAIRVSLGPATTAEEVDRFVDAWGAMVARLRSAA